MPLGGSAGPWHSRTSDSAFAGGTRQPGRRAVGRPRRASPCKIHGAVSIPVSFIAVRSRSLATAPDLLATNVKTTTTFTEQARADLESVRREVEARGPPLHLESKCMPSPGGGSTGWRRAIPTTSREGYVPTRRLGRRAARCRSAVGVKGCTRGAARSSDACRGDATQILVVVREEPDGTAPGRRGCADAGTLLGPDTAPNDAE